MFFKRFLFLFACSGEGGSDILARLKRDLLPVMLNCVMYWPVCDFITFKFFPVHLQVTRTSSLSTCGSPWNCFISICSLVLFILQPLVSNSFSYVWSIYMTYMGNREKPAAISSWNTRISANIVLHIACDWKKRINTDTSYLYCTIIFVPFNTGQHS